MFKWKVCDKCGKMTLADELNFSKHADGTWKDTCKDCLEKEKIERDKRREERRARKTSE
jgi:hypothetical protein